MQITVFGATGKVGSLVTEEALKRGMKVVAFVHRRPLFSPSGQLIIVQGDIYNPVDVAKALGGSDGVVSCLGSWGTPGKDVLSAAMHNIIPAMSEHKIDRIVTLTGSGAAAPGEPTGRLHAFSLKVPIMGAGKVFYDGEEHMRLLAASKLKWTTLRSPVMTNRGPHGYMLNLKADNLAATISRQAVAHALLDQLETDEFLGAAPILHRKRV